MSNTQPPDSFDKLIKEIHEKMVKGTRYLFRGESQYFGETACMTTLRRSFKGILPNEADAPHMLFPKDELDVPHILFTAEQANITGAKKYFPSKVSNLEVLTRLQHYGGDTNFLDFSYNLYVALYFACDTHPEKEKKKKKKKKKMEGKKEGRLILFDTTSVAHRTEIYEKGKKETEDTLFKPPLIREDRRVVVQHSVLLHLPMGKLPKEKYTSIPIDASLKSECLKRLRTHHDIQVGTLYNDLYGYIQNLKQKDAMTPFYQGKVKDDLKDYRGAIDNYTEAIERNPEYAYAYNNRGVAKYDLKYYEKAISDYDRAIEIDPEHAYAYNNRGYAKGKQGKYEEAIRDYDRAIEINSNYAYAYNNRGLAKYDLKDYREAIRDYDRAIEINSNYADAKANQEIAQEALRKQQGS